MPELTLTQKRQAEERAEAAARDERRRSATNKPPVVDKSVGTGTFQMLPTKNANPNDPSLRYKAKKQKLQSFTAHPGEAVKFSDQE